MNEKKLKCRNDYELICKDEKRRREVRKRNLNGLDYLEVGDDRRSLHLFFINRAPLGLMKGNFRIEGGERIKDIEVIHVARGCGDEFDPTRDACVKLTLNKSGDFSIYCLCWVETDAQGRPTRRPPKEVDPLYACLNFSFNTDCNNGLDCATNEESYQLPEYEQPEISYLAKDYASFRQLILDRLALIMPGWNERHIPDIGIALVELLAYAGDYLSYHQDAVATEAYLETARQRISVRRHARLMDYLMHEGCNARAWACLETDQDSLPLPEDAYFVTGYNDRLKLATRRRTLRPVELKEIDNSSYEIFRPLLDQKAADSSIQLHRDHNLINFYTWGNQQCCLPKGATKATLRGRLMEQVDESDWIELVEDVDKLKPPYTPELYLKEGAVVIFEEVLGPKTGNPSDADPIHRQAVRLTNVTAGLDPIYDNQPVVEIEWAAEDALKFPLCLSTIGPAPDCELLIDVSVARGNVVLVDHGYWVENPEALGKVPVKRSIVNCEGVNDCTDTTLEVGKLKSLPLKKTPLTYSQPLPDIKTPASKMLTQDPRKALPEIMLINPEKVSRIDYPGQLTTKELTTWQPRFDLLASGPLDWDFVVEIDNDGCSHLRFGDGIHGRMPQPEPEKELYAYYRVGNGPGGNVGAEAINRVVTKAGIELKVRNPLPAQGGVAAEPMEHVKLFAPGTFLTELRRAVTPEDYVWLAERYPDGTEANLGTVIQRAAATTHWTGSGYEVLLTIDPLGTPDEAELNKLVSKMQTYMQRYRRIVHDLIVAPAHYVPLDIEMCITVLPQYFKGHVKATLLDIFSNRRLPDGRLGFFHPDNLSFGEGVYVSKLIATAQAVTGVESAWVTRLQPMLASSSPDQESPAISQGLLRFGPQEIAQLDNDPNFIEHGRIVFRMDGGR